VAINSALEMDLSGQVCADSIGFRIYSGIGGQMDFIRGAALSPGGKPIIALPSTAAGARLAHRPELKPGAGVVTTRGPRALGRDRVRRREPVRATLRERAEALISIAHPTSAATCGGNRPSLAGSTWTWPRASTASRSVARGIDRTRPTFGWSVAR
jgi:hypothetical protein